MVEQGNCQMENKESKYINISEICLINKASNNTSSQSFLSSASPLRPETISIHSLSLKKTLSRESELASGSIGTLAKGELRLGNHSYKEICQDLRDNHINPNRFNLSKIEDREHVMLLLYSDELTTTVRNLLSCGIKDIIYNCSECNTLKYTRFLCRNTFCSKPRCVLSKIKRAEERLGRLNIEYRRCFHWELGSNSMSKRELERILPRILGRVPAHQKMLYKGKYYLPYIKVFDTTRKGYNHFHILHFGAPIKSREFIAQLRAIIPKVSNKAVFSVAGWGNTRARYGYLAKRLAGKLGHMKEGHYYYDDIMSREEWLKTYHNKRFLSWSFPKGKLVPSRLIERPLLCPDCGAVMYRMGYSYIFTQNDIPDPP